MWTATRIIDRIMQVELSCHDWVNIKTSKIKYMKELQQLHVLLNEYMELSSFYACEDNLM